MKRRLAVALSLAVAAILGGVVMTAVSKADETVPAFSFQLSATAPVAGRAFTASVAEALARYAPWRLSCAASLHGHRLASQRQKYSTYMQAVGSTAAMVETQSCAFDIPRDTAGETLRVTVTAFGNTSGTASAAHQWRISRG
ncbi:MAG TPA: hypothetical protein VFA37_08565 [Gaiellaceae bacterium]|nr:hypothetical protein [Gaiellaceae bacterium]